ncbi:MAG: GNAT family N-acetyltransferase [Candidatus Dormibacteria bacterium]
MSGIGLVRLRVADWAAYRELRLAALADAPSAFGSTFERERALGRAEWQARIRRGGTFAARAAPDLVGTAAGIPGEAAGHAELVGMWVHPEWRGHGVGDLLVRAVIDWATAGRYRALDLWVSVGNDPAEVLYDRHGFVRTGATQPIREEDPTRLELEMVRPL